YQQDYLDWSSRPTVAVRPRTARREPPSGAASDATGLVRAGVDGAGVGLASHPRRMEMLNWNGRILLQRDCRRPGNGDSAGGVYRGTERTLRNWLELLGGKP